MFTVTWREWEYEEVFQVTRIWVRQSRQPMTGNGNPPQQNDTLGVEFPDGDTRIFVNGKFFVMNEQGKTVATYSIGCGDSCPKDVALVGELRQTLSGIG